MGNHLIHTQVIATEFHNKSAALAGQKTLQEIYYQELIPVMEQVMDEYDQMGIPIRIDSLELNLGRIPKGLPVDLIKVRFRSTLEEELRKIYVEQSYLNPKRYKGANSTQNGPKESLESDWEILIDFFRKGKLPWFASSKIELSVSHIFQRILDQNPDRLKTWLIKNPITFTTGQRIINLARSLDKKLLHESLLKEVVSENDYKILNQILKELGKNIPISSQEIEHKFMAILLFANYGISGKLKTYLNAALKVISEKSSGLSKTNSEVIAQFMWTTLNSETKASFQSKHFIAALSNLLKTKKTSSKLNLDGSWIENLKSILQFLTHKSDLSTINKLLSDQKEIEIPAIKNQNLKADEKTVIHNAGLVLTASFLPRFFESLGLVKSGKFISDKARSQAAILLQSMMPEQMDWEEPDLLLNKLLCGMEPAETVDLSGELDPKFVLESALLLESMATQWSALKSKSGKMVSEGFFAREGILKKVQRGYQLQIQRMAFDILLDRLPWSIGIIKLPWMEEIISVEW